jgi:hypothetical protein
MSLKSAIVLFLLTSIAAAQEPTVYWSKGVIGRQINVGHRGFWVSVVGYTVSGYYASCSFSNQTSEPVRVVGARDESGEFRAKATLSVSATQDGPWRKVTHVVPVGHDATLVVRPHSDSEAIIICLNELVPLIDKFDYARISLPTGEATIFSIKELKRR